MEALVQYTIPVKGLGQGIHQFEFQIDRHFFQHFEASPIEDGNVQLKLTFDKRVDMFILDFDIAGTVKTDCDRCLAKIDLPIADQQQLLIKLSLEQESDEAEVVYVSPDISQLNVAKYVYEFICLAMPLIKVYDCENEAKRVCNDEMLAYLEQSETDEPKEAKESDNPIWEELKKFNSDK